MDVPLVMIISAKSKGECHQVLETKTMQMGK